MATYQQPGLPSLAPANQNAPSANLPAVPEYAPQENLGVQISQAIGSGVDAYKKGVQAQKQAAFMSAYGQAYANGDRDALIKLAANNPEQIQAIQQGAGFIDANNNKEIGQAAAELRVAGQQGPEAVAAVAQKHASALGKVGITPDSAVQAYQKDPNEFGHYSDQVGMAALGPKDYFDVQDKITGNQLTARGQDLNAQNQAANREVTIRGQNISASNAAADRQIRMAELQENRASRQLQQAKTGLEIQAAQEKLQAAQTAKQQAKSDTVAGYDSTMDTLGSTITAANQVLKSPGFSGYFGLSASKLPFYGAVAGTDTADTESLVNTLKSKNFLASIQQMKGLGALSDAEGKKIDASIASLDSSISEKQARKSIQTIIDAAELGQMRLRQKQGNQVEQYRSELNPPSVQQQTPAPKPAQQAAPQTQPASAPAATVDWSQMQ